MKTCSKCGASKSPDDFYPRRNACKACHSASNVAYKRTAGGAVVAKRAKAKYRQTDKGRVAEALYRESDAGRESQRQGQARFRQLNPVAESAGKRRYFDKFPEKLAAKKILRSAVRYGKIVKPAACEECMAAVTDPHRLHGHHHDYSKPLDVVWVCQPCHVNEHKALRCESRS